MSKLRLALVQFARSKETRVNLDRAFTWTERAKQQQAEVVVFPEEFSTTYNPENIEAYAQPIPGGQTCEMLSKAAKEFSIHIVGGSIVESDDGSIYSTSTVWDPQGILIAKYRKLHLFDIDIKGKITYYESKLMKAGDSLETFEVNGFKFGLNICYDIRFEEMARLYRNMGCHVLLYPGMFNQMSGRVYWTLLQRSRANDTQCYVAGVSPARSAHTREFLCWGHTQLIGPSGEVLHDLDIDEGMAVADLDMKVIHKARDQPPAFNHRRTDLYETIWRKQL